MDISNFFGITLLFAVKSNEVRIALMDGLTINMSLLSISQFVVGSMRKFVHKFAYMLGNTKIINNVHVF